jgi:hypothetical protein
MKRFAIICTLLLCSLSALVAQEIKLQSINYRTYGGRVRYVYNFALMNSTQRRMNIVGYASLLDADKNVLEKRFIIFDPRPGTLGKDSVESFYGPVPSPSQPRTVSFYKLNFRDDSHHKNFEREGSVAVPLIK